ncbi:SHOCT domain-containing protein [Mameliella alba]|nr:SHOCT domain-containing protein [Mameliella alba]
MMLLFWGLVIAAIFVVVKWLSDNLTGSHRGKRDAMDILRERFAAGEIEEEEFERRKKALER